MKPLSNAPTDSSLDTVCGISTSSSTISPTASHQYLSGILDRLVFRPKSLAAQKFDRGEYEKSAEGSKTATSARLGLLPSKTAQQSSAFSSSKHGVETGTRSEFPNNGLEQHRRPTGLEKPALDLAHDTSMAEDGGSIVLANDEIGLVVTIQRRSGGFHAKYLRTGKAGRRGAFEVSISSCLSCLACDLLILKLCPRAFWNDYVAFCSDSYANHTQPLSIATP